MRIIQENLELNIEHTLAAGVNQADVTLPSLGDRVAFRLKGVNYAYAAASGVPSVTAAGIAIFAFGCVGKEQASPSKVLSFERLLYLWETCYSAAGGGGTITLGGGGPGAAVTAEGTIRTFLFKELLSVGQTLNITNAATTIICMNLLLDAYQLTTSEYVDLF